MAIESPLCTPARSMCSMMPGISTSSPSQMASTSHSFPSMYRSMRTGLPLSSATASLRYRISSPASRTISIARPPST